MRTKRFTTRFNQRFSSIRAEAPENFELLSLSLVVGNEEPLDLMNQIFI